MTPTRPADPARLSPIPYLTVSLSCPSVIYGLLGALLGLTVAGLLLWFDRLLPTDWPEIRFLHDTLELLGRNSGKTAAGCRWCGAAPPKSRGWPRRARSKSWPPASARACC